MGLTQQQVKTGGPSHTGFRPIEYRGRRRGVATPRWLDTHAYRSSILSPGKAESPAGSSIIR